MKTAVCRLFSGKCRRKTWGFYFPAKALQRESGWSRSIENFLRCLQRREVELDLSLCGLTLPDQQAA